MNSRRILIIVSLLLLFFLAVFSLNLRTGIFDRVTENTGLEFTGGVLKIGYGAYDTVASFWHKYLDLRAVREENDQLTQELSNLKFELALAREEKYELDRLRKLYSFEQTLPWDKVGVRILAGRMGSNAALQSIIINKGILTGARPNIPIVNSEGIVGRVRRAGASTSTVLLVCDPLSSVSVIGQESRSYGILYGQGQGQGFELRFVAINSGLLEGELLVSSGLDSIFPKGLPIARVTKVFPSENNPFYIAKAKSLVDFSKLEDLLLLVPPSDFYLDSANLFAPPEREQVIVPDENAAAENISDESATTENIVRE